MLFAPLAGVVLLTRGAVAAAARRKGGRRVPRCWRADRKVAAVDVGVGASVKGADGGVAAYW